MFFVETWAPGSHGTAYIKVNVLPQSVANFTASPEIGCAPLNVSFTDCSTNATYREWDFGDGSPKMINVLNPVHTYAQPGNYTVSLMVHGSTKGTFGWDNNTATKVISVYGVPVSGFSKSITVTFTDQSQYADTVLWDFGDGSTSTERNPTHTYAASGTYNITQTTSNPAGSSVSSSVITI
ncbi:PKD domain-containing protein [Methanosarcina horonobensis]|uniref:PKD domain-containing protein n=1 Tax=Methanosarcina horonobensis TaxID=418008 RepID=UPI002FCDF78A